MRHGESRPLPVCIFASPLYKYIGLVYSYPNINLVLNIGVAYDIVGL